MRAQDQSRFLLGLTVTIASLVSACVSLGIKSPDAIAEVGPASGSQVQGSASFTRTPDGVHLLVRVSGLTPGEHGIHIHEIGDCSAPDAISAKGHFNPTNKPHGGHDGEHHAGDISNLIADADGKAEYSADLTGLEIGSGDSNIIGRALIIHAAQDDYKTQPAGNSGKRVACGVIKAP
jgi:Cu-Zn family superoxide dismutase